jgi:hypothetical protein
VLAAPVDYVDVESGTAARAAELISALV